MSPDRPPRQAFLEQYETDGGPADDDVRTAVNLLLEDRDQWRIHGVTLAGRDDDRLYLLAVRSRVGDAGLLLSIRYYVVDPHSETGQWGADGLEMLVNGPLPQALLKCLARATNDGLGGEQDALPLALGVVGGEVEQDPEALVGPIGEVAEPVEDEPDPEATVECLACGGEVTVEDALEVDMGGSTMWRHRGECDE